MSANRPVGAALLLLAVLTGCGDDGEGAGTPSSTASTASSTTAPSSTGSSAASTTAPPAASTTSVTAAGRVISVTVRGGRPEGGVRRERVTLGETVILRVASDTADEVHVHGYDDRADVAAGGTAEIVFEADIPGVIEVELEESKIPILELEVR